MTVPVSGPELLELAISLTSCYLKVLHVGRCRLRRHNHTIILRTTLSRSEALAVMTLFFETHKSRPRSNHFLVSLYRPSDSVAIKSWVGSNLVRLTYSDCFSDYAAAVACEYMSAVSLEVGRLWCEVGHLFHRQYVPNTYFTGNTFKHPLDLVLRHTDPKAQLPNHPHFLFEC